MTPLHRPTSSWLHHQELLDSQCPSPPTLSTQPRTQPLGHIACRHTKALCESGRGRCSEKGTGNSLPMLLLQAELRAQRSASLCFRHPHSHAGDTVGCPNPLDGNVLSQPLVELSVDGAQLLPLKVSRTQGQVLPTEPALGDPWTLVCKGLANSAQLGTTPGTTPTSQLPGHWPRPVLGPLPHQFPFPHSADPRHPNK